MRISQVTYDKMNGLASKCFDANAAFDNLAYNLEYNYYPNIAKAVHLKVAHVMPEWADVVTDEMLLLGARPTRLPIGSYTSEYTVPAEAFAAAKDILYGLREETRSLIAVADMSDDDEARIFAEEFLARISPYIKQAEEWSSVAERMDPHSLDVHIGEYTNFIGG